MDHILYILPLQNSEAFKVGITNNSNNELNRIKGLHSIYNFNLKDGYLVKSDEKIIKSLERQLLNDYSCYKHDFDIKKDGSTEFLKYDCLDSVLDDVKFKSKKDHLNITIEKGVKFPKTPPRQKTYNKITRQQYLPNPINNDFYNIDKFLLLVKDNIADLQYTEEVVAKDNVSGRIGRIITKDLQLSKDMFYLRGIECHGEYFSFITSAEFNKADNVGYVKLAGLYDNFNQQGYYNLACHVKLSNIYHQLKEMFNKIIIQ